MLGINPTELLQQREKNKMGSRLGRAQGWRGRELCQPLHTTIKGQLNHGVIKAGKGPQGHKVQVLTKQQPQHIPPNHPDVENSSAPSLLSQEIRPGFTWVWFSLGFYPGEV